MKNCIIFLILSFLCINNTSLTAQTDESTDLYKVELVNGNEFIGTIISKTSENIEIETSELGVISIPMKEVKTIDNINDTKVVKGKYYFDNPQSTRYFFAPNGYGLKKGEGYYQNTLIWFNQASYGLTDHISIGGGMLPLFLFGGLPTPVWVNPKLSIPIIENKINLGVGILAGTIIGEDEGGFGIAFGTATFGDRDSNITLGTGFGFAGGQWADAPAITISGMYRVGERAYIITENYALRNASSTTISQDGSTGVTTIETNYEWNAIISFGGRHIWDKISLDYGVFTAIDEGIPVFPLPWLSINVPFGK